MEPYLDHPRKEMTEMSPNLIEIPVPKDARWGPYHE